MTYEDLYGQISASNPENTRILEVTVEADSPIEAKQIVDSLYRIGQEKDSLPFSIGKVFHGI